METFRIRVRTQGTSQQRPYVGKDGKKFNDILIGALETQVLDFTGRMVTKTGLKASQRVLWLSAIYFQRVIARTPRDEDYSYKDEKGNIHYHKDDGDYIQDYWVAKYWRFPGITAKYLRESCGCTFEVFNDPKEIEIIYNEFEKVFFGKANSRARKGESTLKGIRIYCDYPKDEQHELRYKLLEYGGYVGDGIIKQGDNYYHGVANKHSVQAPRGMLAITNAEYESGQFKVTKRRAKNENLIKYSGPTQKMTEELKRIIGNKSKLSDADVNKIMELYGV